MASSILRAFSSRSKAAASIHQQLNQPSTLGGAPVPCKLCSYLGLMLCVAHLALAQPPPPPPPPAPLTTPSAPPASLTTASGKPIAFAIYSAKPHGEGQYGRFMCNGDSCDIQNLSLRQVILTAYGIQNDKLLVGGPSWIDSDRFDIVAKIDSADMPTDGSRFTFQQLLQMLQPVLSDLFGLTTHHETRTFPAYEIVVAKGGLKMKEAIWPPKLPPPSPGAPNYGVPPQPSCLVLSKGNGFRSGHYCSTKDMERVFEYPAGRFLVDKTGLTAHYDFEFCYSNERTPEGDPNYECPAVFTALQEQLGLHLEPSSTTRDVLVIDSARRPTPN